MKIIITKYALSSGCMIAEAEGHEEKEKYFYAKPCGVGANRWYGGLFRKGRDASETEAGAIEIVRKMIAKKRASLQKQLARLDTLDAESIVKHAKQRENVK